MNLISNSILNTVPVVIIILLASFTPIIFAQNPSLTKTYSNALRGLSINYPDKWIVEESNSRYEEGQSSLVDIAEISSDAPDGYRSTIQLEGEGMSPYKGKSIEEIGTFMKDFLSGPGTTIIHSMRSDIGHMMAYDILYEQSTSSGNLWKIKETYIPSENTLYVIRYFTTSPEHFDKYASVADTMIQSVKVDGEPVK